jgi:type 1 glutamine amidotransferase
MALACFFVLILTSCSSKRAATPKVLVFTKTDGFHHESIPNGVLALQSLCKENGIEMDTTSNSQFFAEDSLRPYGAVIFLSTTGNILEGNQEIALERYIQSGGGFVGIHAASDAEYDWRWYGQMIGAAFDSHPAQQDAILNIIDNTHVSTKSLPKQWKRFDEWYNFKNIASDNHVLISIDEKSYQGGKMVHHTLWHGTKLLMAVEFSILS